MFINTFHVINDITLLVTVVFFSRNVFNVISIIKSKHLSFYLLYKILFLHSSSPCTFILCSASSSPKQSGHIPFLKHLPEPFSFQVPSFSRAVPHLSFLVQHCMYSPYTTSVLFRKELLTKYFLQFFK